jgi:hypothetical protein
VVGLAGVLVFGFGAGLVVYGWVRRFEKHLHTREMTTHVHKVVRTLGVVGYTAKGIGYAVAGALFLVAVLTYDASKSRGLDAALHALAGQPYGHLLLAALAAGIAAFGIFCVVQARYRKI